jgi:hypothetical protein
MKKGAILYFVPCHSEIIKYFNNLGVYIAKEGHYLKYIKK